MPRIVLAVGLFMLACGAVVMGAAAPATKPAGEQVKEGVIKSVDADGKGFMLAREPRALPFKVDEKTVVTLDGKAAAFADAVKADLKAKVTYTTVSGDRIASKVEVMSGAVAPATAAKADAPAAASQVKDGVIKTVDADGKGFVMTREPRPLPFKVDGKTEITLDGKAASFAAAVKVDLKTKVTYTIVSGDRIASKVEVTSGETK